MKILLIILIFILIYILINNKTCGCNNDNVENFKKVNKKSLEPIEKSENVAPVDILEIIISDEVESSISEEVVTVSEEIEGIPDSINPETIDIKYVNPKSEYKNLDYDDSIKVAKVKVNLPEAIPKDAYDEYKERQLFIKKLYENNKCKSKTIINSNRIQQNYKNKVRNYDDNLKIDNILAPLLDVLPIVKNFDSQGKIHIDTLPIVKVPMKMDLITNTNFIINSGIQIYQDILQTESNKSYINNIRYNFMQVAWVKSLLKWHGENIDLELRFTNVNPNDGKVVHIVFPLILVDMEPSIIENFSDNYFDFDLNTFKSQINAVPYKFGDTKKGLIYPVSEKTINCDRNNDKIAILKSKGVDNDVIKNMVSALDENTMIREIQKDTNALSNQMNDGIMRPVTENKYFKSNVAYSENKNYHSISKVKSALKNFNYEKIDISTVPTSVDLNKLKNKLISTNFNSITSKIKNVKYTVDDISTIDNLNSLITDPDIIPDFICCTPITGELLTFDFGVIQDKLLSQGSYYSTSGNDGSIVLITKPHPYDINVGSAILSSLS